MSEAKPKNRRDIYTVCVLTLVLSILIFLSPSLGQPQNQTPTSQSSKAEPEFGCGGLPLTKVITVGVEVTDKGGRFVSGLNYRDFIVYEDNQKQDIAFFTEEERLISGKAVIQYDIGYLPNNKDWDDKYRRIRVETHIGKSRKLKIFSSPNGYLAKGPGR